ncbi:MAG: outer membrane protein assembly factor BamA [Paracoccaceae bacterium]
MKLGLKDRFLTSCFTLTLSALAVTAPLVTMPQTALAQSQISFSSIVVTGNQVIPDGTVIALSGLVAGEAVTPAGINEALRRLYAAGLFEFADIRPAAGRMIIEVRENPVIGIVNFEGNSAIKDSELAAITESSARGPLNRVTIEADARRIAALYSEKSRFDVDVRPVIIQRADGRVNLVFEVSEGRIASVDGVNFTGNSRFTDARLRRAVRSGEGGALANILTRDNFAMANSSADAAALVNFYRERGYIDARVEASAGEFALNRDGVFLTYSVYEGATYDFGTSTVATNVEGVDPSVYGNLIRTREGQRYRESRVRETVEAIEEEAARQGRPFLRAVPRYTRNEANGTVDVTFELVNGQRVYVERIDIRGNSQTIDRVIRREFALVEGDAMNPRKIREAEAALQALRYFSNVSVRVREGSSPDQAVVEVDVQDAPTGAFTFGAGYSTDVGFSGKVSISERNLLGRGQRFALELEYGERTSIASISFTEPRVNDRDLSIGGDLYFRQIDRTESSFQTTELGFRPQVSFPLGPDTRLSLNYEIVSEEIRDTVPGTTSPVIIADEGTQVRSAIGFALTHDTRNDTFDPSTGYILRFTGQYAGLGGDADYLKVTGRAKGYVGLFDDALVLSADFEGGAVFAGSTSTRITDRFFLGGTSFRGFNVGGVGPRDDDGGSINDALGGNFYAIARLDAKFPIGLPRDLGFMGGAFVDLGSVWGLDGAPMGASGAIDDAAYLRASAGLALYWQTPLGPLQFSWAYPLLEQPGDVTQVFSVSVSTSF